MPKTSDIDKISQLVQFGKYKTTKVFQRYVRLPHRIIGLFSGNRSMKTSATAFQYILRILGTHPVPKRNVMYFECEKRAEVNSKTENIEVFHEYKERFLNNHKSMDSSTFNKMTRPEDNICRECGNKLLIHKRVSRIIRFASETLPTDKGSISGDVVQSTEVKNTQYPEFKKWLPPFLIKKENINVRNSTLILFDPNANMMFGDLQYIGADVLVEFVSYNQDVQGVAGVDRLSVWEDEEPPLDFHEEQLPRIIGDDGDIIISVTPANGMCFDEETEILSKWGWVGWDKVDIGSEILTFNISKQDLEYKIVDGLYVDRDYKGDMISMQCRGFDALVTPDHRWPVINKVTGEIKVKETKDLKKHEKLWRVVVNTAGQNNEKPIYEDWFVKLAGWFLTDGCAPKNRNYIKIHQSKTANFKKCEKIRRIIKNLPNDAWSEKESQYHAGEPCEGTCINWHITNEYAGLLRALFPERNLTSSFVYKLTNRQQFFLYEAMMDGDGYRGSTGDRFRCTKQTADAFQYLCVLLGKKSRTITEVTKHGTKVYRVNVSQLSERYELFTHITSLERETISYEGIVWCPHTVNDTVVARRNGTVYISSNTWTFDDIFEKAKIIVRTPIICDYYLREEGVVVKEIEHTDSDHDIAVIQSATDDNPTLSPDAIEAIFKEMPDLDGTAIATRRYGIFKQATGRIFKDMNYKVHMIDPRIYGIGPEYINGLVLARTFDFHPANPHAILWAGLSPTDELFIYREWNPSPDKWVTARLCRHMAKESGHEKYVCNLIDPLAKGSKQERDGQVFDTVELMNKDFLKLRQDGIGTGGYWEPFNTKGEVGRDAIKTRLRNSLEVEKPFNNKVIEDGKTKQLPTIWIFKDCRETARSLKQWRLESWASNRQLATRDRKEKHAEKWSHFCTALEGLLKDKRFRPRRDSLRPKQRDYKRFQGGRR